MRNLLKIGALSLMAISFNANAGLVIDDFNDGFGSVATGGFAIGDDVYASFQGAGIFGGERDLIIEKTLGSLSKSSVLEVEDDGTGTGNGFLTWSNPAVAKSVALIQWDGLDDSPDRNFGATGLNVNLLEYGDTIGAEVISTDLAFIFQMGIFTDANNFMQITLASSGDAGPKAFDLANFADDSLCNLATPTFITVCGVGGAADVTNVDVLELAIQSLEPKVDLEIDNVNVPEPSNLALLGLGLLAFGFVTRGKGSASLKA